MLSVTESRRLARHAFCIASLASCTSFAEPSAAITPSTVSTNSGTGVEDAPANHSPEQPSWRDEGVRLGGGLGVALPSGKLNDASGMKDIVNNVMLGHLDAGYRFSPHIQLGGFLEGGTGTVNTNGPLAFCDDDSIDCNVGLFRLGLHARLYPAPGAQAQPWVGAGTGYEWFAFTANDSLSDGSAVIQAAGPELLRLSAGVDIRSNERQLFTVHGAYSVGRFKQVEFTDSINGSFRAQGERHHWLSFSASYYLAL